MIVLIPGWIGFRSSLIPLEQRLRRRFPTDVHRCSLGFGIGCIRRSAESVASRVESWLDRAPEDEPVDVIGHSMGGLVATYLLKRMEIGHRLRTVVTLGTPHRGSPAAFLAPNMISYLSPALAQMAPDSRFLRDLSLAPVPRASRLVSITSRTDGVVPALYATLPRRARQHNRHCAGGSHWGLLFSLETFGLIALALEATPTIRPIPACN